jgi:hypothetical protein
VAGGCCSPQSKGKEVFYPHNQTVYTVTPVLPHEQGYLGGLQAATLLPTDNGNKLILTGGLHGPNSEKSVYEFALDTKNWTRGNETLMESVKLYKLMSGNLFRHTFTLKDIYAL